MSKTKLLTILVIVLVFINIAALSAFFIGGKRGHHGPKKMVIHQLDLDQDQIDEYEVLIEKHQSQIKEKQESLKIAKHKLFNLLQKDNYNTRDQLIENISQIHNEIDRIHFQHFVDLKKICHPDQIKKFNALTDDLARILASPGKKGFKGKHKH